MEQPNQDSRYPARSWASGDCYLVYPGCTSIRFERLVEGIQDFEKIRILKQKATPAQAAALDEVLSKYFASNEYDSSQKAEDLLAKGRAVLMTIQNR